MPSERFVTAGDVRARLLEEGEGEPVLLVHGVAAWAENWSLALPALAAAGFRAIAVDLPGFGQSGRARAPRYFDASEAYYVRFLREVMDAVALDRTHLVGHSMGGAIAAVAAAAMPERFQSLSLVAPGAFGQHVPLSFRLASFRMAELFARLAPTALVRSSIDACFYEPKSVPEWFYAHGFRYARAGGAAEFTRVMHYGVTLSGVRPMLRDHWQDKIRAIKLPTLIVWGRQDAIVPVAQLEDVRAMLPHAQVVLFDRAGHLVQIERAPDFNEALTEFLVSCRSSSTTTATRSPAPSR
ncbi:MAG TPA: alpha/beta fold hydrolase [Candidatus Limnocylindria bacterium]|nr:alpha/beta fold hydrolase [Candidatus Limnocylindria bacterium]